MVEIGIPVYNARKTLPKTLDSLVAQTDSSFKVCLSIDGDNIDYSDIIKNYTARGLDIRIIYSQINNGPGIARQKIIDTTNSDYLIFVDSDDMLLPSAVHSLTKAITSKNFDIIRSGFFREDKEGNNSIVPYDVHTITWFHGKIYSVKYLKEKNIRFHPELRTEEDAYFNILCWNAAKRKGETPEITYLWRYNKDSLTRNNSSNSYFEKSYYNYIFSQVEALKKMPEVMEKVTKELVGQVLVNIYHHYEAAKYLSLPLEQADKKIQELKESTAINQYLDYSILPVFLQHAKPGQTLNEKLIFYPENIDQWFFRLFSI